MLDVALEPKAVRGAAAHRNPHARPVDIGDGLKGRTRMHQIGRFDFAIRVRKSDLGGALRLCADQTDIPGIGPGGIGERRRPLVRHIADGDAEPFGDLGGHVGGNAGRVAGVGLAGHQEEIPHIDGSAQSPCRREFGYDLAVHPTLS